MKPAVKILISEIASKELHITTLERRGRDCFDFHDVSVWGVEDALYQAYSKGKEYARKDCERTIKRLIAASDDIIAAIEGTTDQFEPQVMRLQEATTKAERLLKGGAA
jgi:hypothetical protein